MRSTVQSSKILNDVEILYGGWFYLRIYIAQILSFELVVNKTLLQICNSSNGLLQ